MTLASLHAAKGLEWDVVFLAGCSDGFLPIMMAETPEAIAAGQFTIPTIWAAGSVAWARSPSTVMEREGQRRAMARSSMADRSWASSTTAWP